jgi:hypothetical protein
MQTVDRDRTSSGRIRSEGNLFLNGGEEWVACALEPAGDQAPWDFEVQDWYHFFSSGRPGALSSARGDVEGRAGPRVVVWLA